MDELEDGYAIGLDLGTTFSCIGVYRNGEVEIIPNRNGDKITPSIVTVLDDNTILKGEETLDYLVKNYDSTIYAIKRFIGREYNDRQVQTDIKKESFPFTLIGDPKTKNPTVQIKKNNKIIPFTLEEISSFVIRKLVDNAEKFLGKKVNKLVITVPANFNNAQRNCTKQAALLANIEVLRIINEPTAAALAYGLQDKENIPKGKILVFDLGGGTFDVTILSINKQNEENFEIISTNGNKFLGGEDFDKKLVNYFLDNFCRKMNENKEEILKNKKIIKSLKISCENIKKILSTTTRTTLNITNFYNGKDMIETIERNEFEELCEDLFNKLVTPLDKAMSDAKVLPEDIGEIVLVGGSTRIPKIKSFLVEKFGPNCKINNSINPDEAVAYGATLMAAKILFKRDKKLSGFNLLDINPLSLGIATYNNSKNETISKEGELMSVIIKRASKIPCDNDDIYCTVFDYQKSALIKIYEGEKKYVKYNHILGELLIPNLTPKPKGQVKIKVKFFIDVNGILNVTASELDDKNNEIRPLETKIDYQSIGLNKEKIAEIKEKNKIFYNKIKNNSIRKDFNNTRETLNDCLEALNETNDNDEEERYNILMSFNNTYEEFIDSFDLKNFDNETILEKYYLYLRELFDSYTKILNSKYKDESVENNKRVIIGKIINYIKIFTKKSSGYLNDLLDILQKSPKKIFLEIVVIVIEQMNINGKECLEERKQFCRYNCLMYFENAYSLFNKYIIDITKLIVCSTNIADKCKKEIKNCLLYINEVKTGSILLLEDSIKQGKLINSTESGFTFKLYGFQFSKDEEKEKNEIILQNYEKLLIEINQDIDNPKLKKINIKEPNIKEAICIANIIKISHSYLGKTSRRLLKLCERCEFIAKELGITNKDDWYKEFLELYEDIKSSIDIIDENQREMREKIKRKYKEKFDELERKYNTKRNNKEFIDFILSKEEYQYKNYKNDKKNNKIKFSENQEQEFLQFLRGKYHPDQYDYFSDNENSQLKYCIVEKIESYLNSMYENI